jgi:hypothetical protein
MSMTHHNQTKKLTTWYLTVHWVWRWKKSTHARIIAFYVMGMSTKNLRIAVFVDSTNSIIEKMRVMMRTAIEEKAGLKRCFDTFLSFLV